MNKYRHGEATLREPLWRELASGQESDNVNFTQRIWILDMCVRYV